MFFRIGYAASITTAKTPRHARNGRSRLLAWRLTVRVIDARIAEKEGVFWCTVNRAARRHARAVVYGQCSVRWRPCICRRAPFIRIMAHLRRPLFTFGLYAADLLSPLVAIAVAHWLRYSAMPSAPSLRATLELQSTQFIVLAITVLHVLMLRQAGIYWLHRTWLPFDTFVRVSVICGFTTLVLPLAGMGRDPIMSSRMFLIYFWLVLTMLTYSAKIGAQVIVLAMLCFNIGVKRVVVVGNSETARKLLRVFRQNPQLGYRVNGVLYRGAESGVVDDLAQVKKKLSSGTAPQMLRKLLDIDPDVVIIANDIQPPE